MAELSRVVVGFDGSAEAVEALSWAVGASRRHRLPLLVLVASGDPFYVAGHPLIVPGSTLAERWAAQAGAVLSEHAGDLAWQVEIREQKPSHALIRESGPDCLTVVGAVGHGKVAGLLLGSVSQHVASHGLGTIVVVRAAASTQAQRIVVGVDGSPESQEALEFALAEADRGYRHVTAVYAQRPRAVRRGALPQIGPVGPLDGVHEAQRLVAETIAGYREKYPDVQLQPEVFTEDAVRALTGASERAAMVVVGAHGRGAFPGMLLGSVSHAVLAGSQCTVAVVHSST
jgi:nucleotide-binding universal stress UspA family protein